MNELPNRVTFVTTLFNTTEVRDYFINASCFGDDCAAWLIAKLKVQAALQVDDAPTQEDWGWCFGVTVGQRSFLLGVGLSEDDAAPPRWLIFVDSQLGLWQRKLFGQNDQRELRLVCEALRQALNSEPLIRDIQWE